MVSRCGENLYPVMPSGNASNPVGSTNFIRALRCPSEKSQVQILSDAPITFRAGSRRSQVSAKGGQANLYPSEAESEGGLSGAPLKNIPLHLVISTVMERSLSLAHQIYVGIPPHESG